MISKSTTFDIYHAIPLYQPNNDEKTASLYTFTNPSLAISTDNRRFAELGAHTLQQCSGNHRIKLCRKSFSTATGETLLCLGSLFYNYDIPALRNCQVISVLLSDAPQAFNLADGMYHIISRTAMLQIKNDSRTHDLSISSTQCQACVMRPSCNSIISFNQGDLVLHSVMDFCETQPGPFLASIELTPSLQNVFSHVPDIGTTEFQAYLQERRDNPFSVVSEWIQLNFRMSSTCRKPLSMSSQNRLLSTTRPSPPPHQPLCNPTYPFVPLFSCPRCLSQCLYLHSH